jgi:hypothetical protein
LSATGLNILNISSDSFLHSDPSGATVSNSESVAVYKTSSRGFLHTLILGSLCATAALMMQTANFAPPHTKAVVRPPMLMRLLSEPRPVQPSAYDEESIMSPAQLINRWDGIIAEASQRFHIPKDWIRAVMRQESGGRTMLGENQPIVSHAGAVGLMQVLPATYGEMAAQHGLGGNPFDARDNIMAGTAYLRWLHQKYGYPAMFAAYNAGPGRVENHLEKGASLPAETRAYIGNIAKSLKIQIGKIQTGKSRAALVKLTQPDGATVGIDPGQVTAIRAALPGEYDWSVKSVLILGKHKQQAIREDTQVAAAVLRTVGKSI